MAFLKGFLGYGGFSVFPPLLQGIHNVLLKEKFGGVMKIFRRQVDFSKRNKQGPGGESIWFTSGGGEYFSRDWPLTKKHVTSEEMVVSGIIKVSKMAFQKKIFSEAIEI